MKVVSLSWISFLSGFTSALLMSLLLFLLKALRIVIGATKVNLAHLRFPSDRRAFEPITQEE